MVREFTVAIALAIVGCGPPELPNGKFDADGNPICSPEPSEDCPNGPRCGDKCCDGNEQCNLGECTCGSGPRCDYSNNEVCFAIPQINQCGLICCNFGQGANPKPCPH